MSYKEAIKTYFSYALPSVGGMALMRGPALIDYIVAGQLGDPAYVAGFGLSLVTLSVITVSIGIGLSGGICTLCSQAFGSGNNKQAGQFY